MTGLNAEVLVVGGGPAGAATATWLARRGRNVLVLDKATFPREKPCGEFFSPGVVAALRRLGALDTLRGMAHAQPLGMRVVTIGGEALDISYSGASAEDGGGGFAIDRFTFDAALLDNARACGAAVDEGVQVAGAIVEDGLVVGVSARRHGGRLEEIRGRVVVAADGANSSVAHSLGLPTPVRWPRRLGLAAHYEGVDIAADLGEMHVGNGVCCGIASVGERVSVALAAPADSKRPGETSASLFERLISLVPSAARRLRGARRIAPVRGIGPLARRVARTAGRGFLLVGDAAGFFDPFTGEGVHRALVGAELAADGVERALGRSDGFPTGYEAARRRVFAHKERVCFLVQMFLAWPWGFDFALSRLNRRPGAAELLSGVLGDYRPASDALTPSFLWQLLRP